MTVDTIIAELKSNYPRYNEMGAFDPKSLYTTAYIGLKRLGNLIAVYSDYVVDVINGQATLPEDFWQIALAIRVRPKWYNIVDKDRKAVPQAEIGYIETINHGFKWDSCNECCVEEKKTAIKKTLYLYQHKVEYHYKDPEILHIGKDIPQDPCYHEYRERYGLTDRGTINIVDRTLYAPFDGLIYLWYKGIPIDKDRKPYIPKDPNGSMYQYIYYLLEASVLKKLKHKYPNERANIIEDLQYAMQQQAFWENRARTDLKMNNLSFNTYAEIRNEMHDDIQIYEDMLPVFPNAQKIFIGR